MVFRSQRSTATTGQENQAMQASLTVPCELSRTGSHNVTFTFDPDDGRVVNVGCPCRPEAEDVEVTRALGMPTCADALVGFRRTIETQEGYNPSGVWCEEVNARAKVAGIKTPRGFMALLSTAIEGSVRVHEERATPEPIRAAGVSDISRRFTRVVNAVCKKEALHYRFRVRHLPGEGVVIQSQYAGGDGVVLVWRTVAVAPTGSGTAFAIRTTDVVGDYDINNDSDKPNWCRVCGAPIRGMGRHASSAPHRAKVRRDIFRLVKAVWPQRTAREAHRSQLDAVAEGLLRATPGEG